MTGILGAIAAPYPGFSVTITDRSVTDFTTDGSPSTATYTVKNDGTIRDQDSASLETWLQTGSATNWDVRATLQSGTSPSGDSVGSWLNCGTSRSWSLTDSTQNGSPVSCTLLIELRSGGVVANDATVSIQALCGDPI